MTSPISDILQQTAKEWLENDGRPKHLLLDLEEAEQAILQVIAEAIENSTQLTLTNGTVWINEKVLRKALGIEENKS